MEANAKIYFASKVIETLEEYHNSPEFAQIWDGWQGKQSCIKIDQEFEFIKAFVIKVDPKLNYGREFKLYKYYKCSDGLLCVKETKVSSSLTSGPFQLVKVFEGGFTLTDQWADKCAHNRKILINEEIVVN